MIDLYAAATPNGRKITIMLQEIGMDYRLHRLELSRGEQRRPDFLRLNPNGKIPVIVDTSLGGQAIAESGAILVYLAEKSGQLLPVQAQPRLEVLQWLFFQVGSLGPNAGHYNHFRRHEPRDEYAFNRFRDEVMRLLGVMDDILSQREFIAGAYSIADIAMVPWVRALQRWNLSVAEFSHVAAWYGKVMDRGAVQRGFAELEAA